MLGGVGRGGGCSWGGGVGGWGEREGWIGGGGLRGGVCSRVRGRLSGRAEGGVVPAGGLRFTNWCVRRRVVKKIE